MGQMDLVLDSRVDAEVRIDECTSSRFPKTRSTLEPRICSAMRFLTSWSETACLRMVSMWIRLLREVEMMFSDAFDPMM